jgi:hypothetical protein
MDDPPEQSSFSGINAVSGAGFILVVESADMRFNAFEKEVQLTFCCTGVDADG